MDELNNKRIIDSSSNCYSCYIFPICCSLALFSFPVFYACRAMPGAISCVPFRRHTVFLLYNAISNWFVRMICIFCVKYNLRFEILASNQKHVYKYNQFFCCVFIISGCCYYRAAHTLISVCSYWYSQENRKCLALINPSFIHTISVIFATFVKRNKWFAIHGCRTILLDIIDNCEMGCKFVIDFIQMNFNTYLLLTSVTYLHCTFDLKRRQIQFFALQPKEPNGSGVNFLK